MSERARDSSLSGAVRELIARLPRWESRMAAWPQVVSERLALALKTAQDEAEAHHRSEARAWAQERAAWRQEMQGQLQRLTALTERQNRLLARYEAETAPWVLTWSRDRWQQVAANVTVTLGVSLILLALFWWTGPTARDRAQLSTYQQLWGVMTEAEQNEIRQRLWPKTKPEE